MRVRDLEAALREARIIVCAGTGGVGKTTISAAIALEAARAGRKTLVLTIDPARRLADALGLAEIGSTPTRVQLDALSTIGPFDPEFGDTRADSTSEARDHRAGGGRLDAMMLDAKPTFDALITRFAKDDELRDRILGNRIYRHLSEALAGSAEYAAMVQVHDLIEQGEYDLIVVDTPPADHALDFLRAPRRMREFLESRFVRSLVHPAVTASRFGARLFGRGLERVLKLIERIAGRGFLDDISEFLTAVDGLSLGFDERSKRVEEFLLGDDSSFVLVCGGQARANRSALEFLSRLEDFRVPLVAVVANRLRPWPTDRLPRAEDYAPTKPDVAADLKRLSEAAGDPDIGEEIAARLSEYAEGCAAQNRGLSEIEAASAKRGIACIHVRELSGDVDHLAGLAEIGTMLARHPTESTAPGSSPG